MADTLLLTTAGSVFVALLYLYLAWILGHRPVSADARVARDLFAWWWALLGMLSVLGALQVLLWRADRLPIWLFQTLAQLGLWFLFIALWSLQVYLIYLYRGHTKALIPLGAFYAVLYIGVVALIHWAGPPQQVLSNGWQLYTEPQLDLPRGVGLAFILVLLGPQVAAAASYARLFGKTRDRTQRYRIAMLTGAIIVWFGTSIVVGAVRGDTDPADANVAWEVASRLLSVAAALTILAAYRPPRWVQRRYGVRSITHDGATEGST